MKQLDAICARNLKIYSRDKGTILSSFLSMLIIIGLMLLFLGDTTVSDVMTAIKKVPGRGTTEDLEAAKRMIYLWTMAGVLAINSATVTLAFYSNMIKDRSGNRLNSILVMPVKRSVIVAGYIVSAWITSVVMCSLTLTCAEVIGLSRGIAFFSAAVHLKLFGYIMVNSFTYSAMMFFFASVIRTEGAWNGFGIIVGSLIGFLGGIYFPIGALNPSVAKLVKGFPAIYGTSLFRTVMLESAEQEFFRGTAAVGKTIFDEKMGVSLIFGKNALSSGGKIGILILTGFLFALLSLLVLAKGRKTDR